MHEEKNASAEIGKIKALRVLVTTTLLLLRFLNLRSFKSRHGILCEVDDTGLPSGNKWNVIVSLEQKVVEITFLSNWVKETNDGDLVKLVKIMIVLKSNQDDIKKITNYQVVCRCCIGSPQRPGAVMTWEAG